MKTRNLLLGALVTFVAAGLLASASFAQSRTCNGVINDETILQDVEILNGKSCIISDSTIRGSIIGDSPNTVIIFKTKVDNLIVISNASTVAISDVIVDDGNIEVVDSDIASVVDNRTLDGDIRVSGNRETYVIQNDAEGNIICSDNTFLEYGYNTAGPGGDRCPLPGRR